MLRLFISSVQKEFASERAALRSNFDVVGSVAAQPESRPESQPESLEGGVLRLLVEGPLAKSELSSGLRQKEISGQLNKVIRLLLADQSVEYTIPDKPNSRLQKYRLTAKGRTALAALQPKGNA